MSRTTCLLICTCTGLVGRRARIHDPWIVDGQCSDRATHRRDLQSTVVYADIYAVPGSCNVLRLHGPCRQAGFRMRVHVDPPPLLVFCV